MNSIGSQLCLLFMWIATGFVANKAKVLTSEAEGYFSSFLIKIALPASTISAVLGDSGASAGLVAEACAVAAAVFVLLPVAAQIIGKFVPLAPVYKLLMIYPNLGFMGIPVISSIYGTDSVVYVSMFMIFFNLSLFSYGETIMGSGGFSLKKIINPGSIASAAALVIFILGIGIPEPFSRLFESVGNITSPLAMIVIGSSIASVRLGELIRDKRTLVCAAVRVFIVPLILFAVLLPLDIDKTVMGISVLLMSMPVAGNVPMLCMAHGSESSTASGGLCISTLLSLITIPLYAYIFAYVF